MRYPVPATMAYLTRTDTQSDSISRSGNHWPRKQKNTYPWDSVCCIYKELEKGVWRARFWSPENLQPEVGRIIVLLLLCICL
jgi:hypothetical protein